MSAPLIGLTGRKGRGEMMGMPRGFADAALDIYLSEYATSVVQAGGIPVHLSPEAGPAVVERLDGLIIAGGDDVDSRRYGQAPGPKSGPFDTARDDFEFSVLEAALDRDIPVLGVCRGNQLINVALGGTLVQHLEVGTGESHASYAYPRAHRSHEVSIDEGSVIHGLYGPTTRVNSFHHQAVDEPGKGIVVVARAADGVIEGIELSGRPVVGVQWHPECFGGDPIFEWLVTASQERQRSQ